MCPMCLMYLAVGIVHAPYTLKVPDRRIGSQGPVNLLGGGFCHWKPNDILVNEKRSAGDCDK